MKSSIKKLMFTFAFAFGALTMVSCGEHKHNLAKDWSKDATKHWHDCDGCDELVDKAAHAWGNWIVDEEATETTKGEQHRVCSVCGYVGTEAIPMLPPEFGVATELTAVYAQVPADWEDDVNIYYWAGNEGNSIAEGYGVGWPGTPMTLVNEEEHIWGFKVPAGTDHVIFNRGGSIQTVDIDFAPAKNLYVLDEMDGSGKYTIYYSTYAPTANDPELGQPQFTVIEKITMYTQVPEDWENVTLYFWGSAIACAEWPGEAMDVVDEAKHIYSYDVPEDAGGFTVTSNGKPQTVDLFLEEGVNAYVVTELSSDGEKYNAAPKFYEEGEFTDVEIVEETPVLYVRGDMNGWGVVEEYKLAYDEDSDVATLEVELEEGVGFKVADANWKEQFGFGRLADTTGFEDDGGNIKVVVAGTYVVTVTDVSTAARACSITLKA